jgi:leishmanolysin
MYTSKIQLCTLIGLLLLGSVSSRCMHDEMEHNYEIVSDWDPAPEGRLLADTYGGLRIVADYSLLTGAPSASLTYIRDRLVPAAINYFYKALQVPQLSSFVLTDSTSCGLKIPSIYKTGVQADLLLLVTGESSTESWVAWAGACKLLKSTNRPIVGQVNFNYRDIAASTDIEFENDLYSVLHEIAHVLGFSDSLFKNYLVPPKTGTTTANGVTYSYVDVEPLTTKLRNYFNCPTLKGAFMENSGGSGSAGSHFERTTFGNEIMTASEIADTRFSELTLALLEGTGWYKVNYDMAEPFHWGRGKGCTFVTSCSTGFSEFCSGSGESCTYHGRHGGYCSSDSFGDKCDTVQGYNNVDCENPDNQKGATLSAEKYAAGSRCFLGSLYTSGSLSSARTYCFSYTCVAQAGGKFDLTVNVGSSSAKCTQKGSVTVSGYKGSLQCPDPQEYCSTIGAPFLREDVWEKALVVMENVIVKLDGLDLIAESHAPPVQVLPHPRLEVQEQQLLAPLHRAPLHLAPLHLAPLHLPPLHLPPLHLPPLHLPLLHLPPLHLPPLHLVQVRQAPELELVEVQAQLTQALELELQPLELELQQLELVEVQAQLSPAPELQLLELELQQLELELVAVQAQLSPAPELELQPLELELVEVQAQLSPAPELVLQPPELELVEVQAQLNPALEQVLLLEVRAQQNLAQVEVELVELPVEVKHLNQKIHLGGLKKVKARRIRIIMIMMTMLTMAIILTIIKIGIKEKKAKIVLP